MMLYFANGIDSEPKVTTNVMTQQAMYEIMVPLITDILGTIEGLKDDEYLVTFSHDDCDEDEYVKGNKDIETDISDDDMRSLTICENCRFNIYFMYDYDADDFDTFMHKIFRKARRKSNEC